MNVLIFLILGLKQPFFYIIKKYMLYILDRKSIFYVKNVF